MEFILDVIISNLDKREGFDEQEIIPMSTVAIKSAEFATRGRDNDIVQGWTFSKEVLTIKQDEARPAKENQFSMTIPRWATNVLLRSNKRVNSHASYL